MRLSLRKFPICPKWSYLCGPERPEVGPVARLRLAIYEGSKYEEHSRFVGCGIAGGRGDRL